MKLKKNKKKIFDPMSSKQPSFKTNPHFAQRTVFLRFIKIGCCKLHIVALKFHYKDSRWKIRRSSYVWLFFTIPAMQWRSFYVRAAFSQVKVWNCWYSWAQNESSLIILFIMSDVKPCLAKFEFFFYCFPSVLESL